MAVQYAFSQITTQGLKLAVDAADPLSYPGSGTTWTDVTVNGFTGTVSSSISFVATNRGALYSANSSSAVTFSGSAVNFGTDSFTVEMAFSPQVINGQHFLYSKNSGSFPNFGAFLTGSGGSGRLVAFYNVSSTVSCSASTPTGSFITGSNYIVDVTYAPFQFATFIYTNSNLVTQSLANGTGSLSTSASLFLLNNSTSSNAGSVANLYSFKVYNPYIGPPFVRKNYNAQAARFGLPLATYIPPAPLLLDTYSGAAAAYSLRKLRTSYPGAAIRVRRSSDNAEADIGFNVNGDLDTGTLLNFCGVGNGFVTTWYDQSTNGRNASQTTGSNQPQVVTNGSLYLKNNKPSIRYAGAQVLIAPISPTITYNTSSQQSVYGIFSPHTSFSSGQFGRVFTQAPSTYTSSANGYDYAANHFIPYLQDSTTSRFGPFASNSFINTSSLSLNSTYLFSSYNIGSGQYSAGLNNEPLSTRVLATGADYTSQGGVAFYGIGRALASPPSELLYVDILEIVSYMSDNTLSRTAIQSNINSYYSIY